MLSINNVLRNNIIIKLLIVIFLSYVLGAVFVSSTIGQIFVLVILFFSLLLVKTFSSSYDSIITIILIAVFFIPFSYFPFLNIFNVLNPVVLLGIVLASKVFYEKFIIKKQVLFQSDPIDYLYLAFIISALISTLFAISKLGALNWVFYSYITGFLIYKVLTNLKTEQIVKIVKLIVIIATLCSFYGIVEFLLFRRSLFLPEIRVGTGRLTSCLGHPLLNGIIYTSIWPLSYICYLQTKKRIYILTSFILIVAILLTFSRGSWLAGLIGLFFLFSFLNFRYKLRSLLAFLILGLIFSVISPLRQEVRDRIFQSERKSFSSWNIRIKSIPIAFQIVKERPFFGGGPFNASRYKDRFAPEFELRKTSFENSYLGLLVDLGFVGLSIFIAIVIFVLWKCLLILCAGKSSPYYFYRVGSFVSLIILLVNMATFNFDSYRLFHFFLWFYLGLNIGLTKDYKNEN